MLAPALASRLRHPAAWLLAFLLPFLAAPPARAVPGDVDALNLGFTGAELVAIAHQPDGKTLVAGNFLSVLGVPRRGIARLHADFTVDLDFDPNPNGSVEAIVVQPDGRIILLGGFTSLQPNGGAVVARGRIARVEADGSLDASYHPNANGPIGCAEYLPDGSLLVGGNFTAFQPGGTGGVATRPYLARITPGGGVDSFYPGPNGIVSAVLRLPNGDYLVGGLFSSFQSGGTGPVVTRRGLARFSAGVIDPAFNAGLGADVYTLFPLPDDQILVGGAFSQFFPPGAPAPILRRNAARITASGVVDPSFDPSPNGPVYAFAPQADGRILFSGIFSELQPNGAATPTSRLRLARVLANGEVDAGFELFPDGYIRSVGLTGEGRVLIAGFFQNVQANGHPPVPRRLFARLDNELATQFVTAPSANRALWTRNSTSSLVEMVTFELSTDGGVNWSPLGDGTRVGTTPNWELTGLSLPGSGLLRARGRERLGDHSSGMVEQVGAFPFVPSPEVALEYPPGTGRLDGATIYFGPVAVGNSGSAQTFVVRNTGVADLTLGSITKNGAHPGDFAIDTSALATTVPPGGSTTFTVTFTPGATGPRTAALHLASNDADENPFDLVLIGNPLPEISLEQPDFTTRADGSSVAFGTVPTGTTTTRTFRVRNLGAGPLNLGALTVDGAQAAEFVVDATGLLATVPPGGFTTFRVLFTPAATGSRTAALHLVNDDPNENPYDLSLSGLGAAAPEIALEQPPGTDRATGSSISFGNVHVGQGGAAQTFVVRNTGAANLSLLDLFVDGDQAGEFILDTSLTDETVAPGASTTFAIRFYPGAAGFRSAFLQLDNNDPDENPFILQFGGSGFTLPGDLDPLEGDVSGAGLVVTVVQPDGKIIIAGDIGNVQGVPRSRIARLHADGALDLGFDPKANSNVFCAAVQADGKILIGGLFTTLQPNGAGSATTRRRLARLNPDGTLDTAFNPNLTSANYCAVNSIVVQPDGKLLVGGFFEFVQPPGAPSPILRNNLVRLLPDGTVDPGFDPSPNGTVHALALQPDGRIVVGGEFLTLQPNGAPSPTTCNRLARLLADGSLDSGFSPGTNDAVLSILVQPDGRLLVAGFFTELQATGAPALVPRAGLARLEVDGTLDAGFHPSVNGAIFSQALQNDGRIVIAGIFNALQPGGVGPIIARRSVARVLADGSVDPLFDPSPDNFAFSVALQTDGRVVLGGQFNELQPNGTEFPIFRPRFALLLNEPAAQVLSVPGATQVLWSRSGTGPQFDSVTFELSTNGGASWTPLGAGSRLGTSANWERTGLALPGSGLVRARGRGGDGSSSFHLFEQQVAFPAADLAVEQPAGNSLFDGQSTLQFPAVPVGSLGAPLTVTVRNLGTAPLNLGSITTDGPHADEFLVDATTLAGTLAPGASTTFTVTFVPEALGLRTAALHLTSTDPDESPFDLALNGGLTPYETWVLGWFGSPDTTGPAARTADPNVNAIPNLLEYALGGVPNDGSISGTGQGVLPQLNLSSGRLQVSFARRLDRTDVDLTVQGSDGLTGPWTPLAQSVGGAPFVSLLPGVIVNESGAGNIRNVTVRDAFQLTDPAHPRRFLRLEASH